MIGEERRTTEVPGVLDVAPLLSDGSSDGLARGQVGTIVELLAEESALVECCDDNGRAHFRAVCPSPELSVLHDEPQAA